MSNPYQILIDQHKAETIKMIKENLTTEESIEKFAERLIVMTAINQMLDPTGEKLTSLSK